MKLWPLVVHVCLMMLFEQPKLKRIKVVHGWLWYFSAPFCDFIGGMEQNYEQSWISWQIFVYKFFKDILKAQHYHLFLPRRVTGQCINTNCDTFCILLPLLWYVHWKLFSKICASHCGHLQALSLFVGCMKLIWSGSWNSGFTE